ncbi:MAG: NAD-dependent epimerase/dehydratase family protein [bacterium]
MKAAITGIGSMVGFHLARRLSEEGHTVVGVDIASGANTDDLESLANITLHQVDIANLKKLREAFRGADVIYNLAAVSSERLVKENFPLALRVNVTGTANCLEIAKETGAKLVYASSAAVYPDPGKAYRESDACLPGTMYGTTKFISEEFARLYNKNFDVRFTILRFERIYGSRMKRNPVYDMALAFSKNKKVVMYESLECEYDFIHVSDAVNALVMANEAAWDNREVNIGTGKTVKLGTIYDTFRDITGNDPGVDIKNDKKGKDLLNTELARSLGWEPRCSLKEGVEETVKYFSNAK